MRFACRKKLHVAPVAILRVTLDMFRAVVYDMVDSIGHTGPIEGSYEFFLHTTLDAVPCDW